MSDLRKAAQAILDYSDSGEAGLQGWPDWDAKFDALRAALEEDKQTPPLQPDALAVNPTPKLRWFNSTEYAPGLSDDPDEKVRVLQQWYAKPGCETLPEDPGHGEWRDVEDVYE